MANLTVAQRPASRTFQDLIVWQKAHALVLAVYGASTNFPRSETYGLTAQMRRAVISVPANIAEGFRKSSRAEKVHFMNIAQGSLEEVRYYLILVRDLGYLSDLSLTTQLEEVSKLLERYRSAIQTRRFLHSDS